MRINEDGTATTVDAQGEIIEISADEVNAMQLNAVNVTRKHVNTLLQSSGQPTAEGISKTKLKPKSTVELMQDRLRKNLVENGTIPAQK